MSRAQASPQSDGTSYRYVIADVFTETAFGGNQLAVFPDARGLSADQMQAIAREFNFAETTFVLPAASADGRDRIRIFTPRREMPFAGHPTVGTAAVMTYLGLARSPDADGAVTYDEGIGPVTVHTSPAAGRRVFAELSLNAALERPPGNPVRADLAACLSLSEADILDAWYAAIGIPFCYVHLAHHHTVDEAVLDRQHWKAKLADTAAPQIFLFSGTFESGRELYARMFAPALGIEEDPATGSACVTLIGELARRQRTREPIIGLSIRQGVAMGRPSFMKVYADLQHAEVRQLRLGGNSVMVAEGIMNVPSDLARLTLPR